MKEKSMPAAKPRKKRKTVLVVLLVILALFMLVSAAALYLMSNWEKFKKPMLLNEYPYAENQGRVLLAGSSFMEKWKTFEEDLAPLDVMNVAVGGTKVGTWQGMYDELIVPYNPRAVVIYVGSNNISGTKSSEAGDVVFKQVKTLFESISEELPETEIYYVSICPTPRREKVWQDAALCNSLMEEFCETDTRYHFIDCTDVLLDENGGFRRGLYGADKLHFSESGYAIWAEVLREGLEALY